MRITVDLKDLKKLQRLIAGDDLYAEPWSNGMNALATRGGLAAQRGAPVFTGALQGKIRTKVQQRPFPTWIAIRNTANRKGFPYPRLLAFSSKHHHRDWLLKAVMPVWGNAGPTLQKIGQEIARIWGRN